MGFLPQIKSEVGPLATKISQPLENESNSSRVSGERNLRYFRFSAAASESDN